MSIRLLDLSGNNLKIVDVSTDFGIFDSKEIRHFGYNKKSDRLWFVLDKNNNSNLVEYSYDINLKKYIKITENNDFSPFCFEGREIFTISKFYRIGAGRSDNFIFKRNLDNSDNKEINLNYLGEKADNSEALGVLYNEDYLWVILKRKLLKLEIL